MNILITGISNGIGKAMCIQAMKSKHNVIGLSRSEDAFVELQKYATQFKTSFHGVQLDPHQVIEPHTEKLQALLNQLPKVDVLINNAGLLYKESFLDLTPQTINQLMQVNLYYPMFLTQWLYNAKQFRESAHIVNIGSMGGFQGSLKFPGLIGYSISKGALGTFTECLSAELNDSNIAVNCLCLGAVQTEMLSNAFPGYIANVAPEAMARYILDFATARPILVNGKVLPIAQNNP